MWVSVSTQASPDLVCTASSSRTDCIVYHNHTTEQVMHGLFPKRVAETVLDAMTDHEKLSLEVLDSKEAEREFALLILKMLTATSGPSVQPLGEAGQETG